MTNQATVSATRCRQCQRKRGDLHAAKCPRIGGLERHTLDCTVPDPLEERMPAVDINMIGVLAVALAAVIIGGLLWTM